MGQRCCILVDTFTCVAIVEIAIKHDLYAFISVFQVLVLSHSKMRILWRGYAKYISMK